MNPVWYSLGPLIVINVTLLATVLVFRPIYHRRERLKEVEEREASPLLNRWMREYWLWLTDPFVRLCIKAKISPNQLTLIGVMISTLSGLCFWKGKMGLGGWLMIIAATFDIFDGRVARGSNKETKSGAYFDSVMDRVSEGVVFMGLAGYYRTSNFGLWLVFMALVGSFLVSYARARGDASGVSYNGGWMQRPERIVYLGVGAIFCPVFGYFISQYFPKITTDVIYYFPLAFVAIGTFMTSINRIKKVMKMLDA